MDPEAPQTASQQLIALKQKVIVLQGKLARETPSWNNTTRQEILRTKAEIAKLVWPKFSAMNSEELWAHVYKCLQASIRRLDSVSYTNSRRKENQKDIDVESVLTLAVEDFQELDTVLKYIRQLRSAFDSKTTRKWSTVGRGAIWEELRPALGPLGDTTIIAVKAKLPPYRLAADYQFESFCAPVTKTLELLQEGDIDFVDRDIINHFLLRSEYNFLRADVEILKEPE